MAEAISSGLLDADAVILAGPGKLMGAQVISNGTNAVLLELWDSPDATLTSDSRLCEISLGASPATGELTKELWFGPDGMRAYKGIYADITQASGTIKFYVWHA
jgi:hypothetical protein